MSNLKVSVISYSLSEDPATLNEWRSSLEKEILDLIQGGSGVILYPELFLMGVARYFQASSPQEEIQKVASYIAADLLPGLKKLLNGKDVFLVLGSGPRNVKDKIFNSAPIFQNNDWSFQDKLFLTPWETDFTPGEELKIYNYKNLKTAVVICFDSEQPDLAKELKTTGIDLMLLPSATTNKNGSQRVNRCASARAIELGAAVFTSPLVGDSPVDLIDHNEGAQGYFLPAQDDVIMEQEVFSAYSKSEKVLSHFNLDLVLMRKLKEKTSETKPYHKPHHPKLVIK